jgi:Na+-transporting NADH:ubiquinone oxidoreductase subunit NqrE
MVSVNLLTCMCKLQLQEHRFSFSWFLGLSMLLSVSSQIHNHYIFNFSIIFFLDVMVSVNLLTCMYKLQLQEHRSSLSWCLEPSLLLFPLFNDNVTLSVSILISFFLFAIVGKGKLICFSLSWCWVSLCLTFLCGHWNLSDHQNRCF